MMTMGMHPQAPAPLFVASEHTPEAIVCCHIEHIVALLHRWNTSAPQISINQMNWLQFLSNNAENRTNELPLSPRTY